MKKAKIAVTLLALSMAAGHQAHAFGLGDLTKAVTGTTASTSRCRSATSSCARAS